MKHSLRIHALALIVISQSACAGTPAALSQAGASAPAATVAAAANLNGIWKGNFVDPQGGTHDIELQLTSDGKTLTGTLLGGPPDGAEQPILDGRVDGNKIGFDISFKGIQGEEVRLRFEGTVKNNQIRGVHGMARMPLDFVWDAKKV